MADPTFLGLNSTDWTAITGIATAILVAVAYVQISAARGEAQISRTLAACERYDLDPLLDQICRTLADARDDGSLEKDPRKYRIEIFSILNYLESIAIGVDRGLYDNSVVYDLMEPIMKGYVEEYLDTGLAQRAERDPPVASVEDLSFSRMRRMVADWPPKPWYRSLFMAGRPKI